MFQHNTSRYYNNNSDSDSNDYRADSNDYRVDSSGRRYQVNSSGRPHRADSNSNGYRSRNKRRNYRTERGNYYKFLSNNNNRRLNNLMEGSRANTNETNENNIWNNASAVAEPSCLDYDKDECVAPDCKWDTNKCVPNVLHTENNCYGKPHSACIDRCKWYGNVHTGKCYATFGSIAELKEEHEMVNKELKTFKKFIKMLHNKNKSLIFYIRKRINDININIDKLMKRKKSFKSNLRGIKQQNNLETRLNTYKETTGKLGELKMEKENLKQILHNIKYERSANERSAKRPRERRSRRHRRSRNLFA
jgi:hypothetical protein